MHDAVHSPYLLNTAHGTRHTPSPRGGIKRPSLPLSNTRRHRLPYSTRQHPSPKTASRAIHRGVCETFPRSLGRICWRHGVEGLRVLYSTDPIGLAPTEEFQLGFEGVLVAVDDANRQYQRVRITPPLDPDGTAALPAERPLEDSARFRARVDIRLQHRWLGLYERNLLFGTYVSIMVDLFYFVVVGERRTSMNRRREITGPESRGSLTHEEPTESGGRQNSDTYLGLISSQRTKRCTRGLLARRAVAQVLHERGAAYLNFDAATEARGGSDGHSGGDDNKPR